MKAQLKTTRKQKSEELRAKIIAMFADLENVEGSDWQKCGLIAKKLKITQNHASKVTRAYLNENRSTNA